ncbi:hypothetical protein E2C01_062232 [Portunus trituberculatus]|uniref:Uncharacterized protein n=1 Tax=Portunus trituberculatus TaxID=210409 RepID=A0A5B7HAE2_PORTR|nr:hypothetical protein [Portunus trituberculatus]
MFFLGSASVFCPLVSIVPREFSGPNTVSCFVRYSNPYIIPHAASPFPLPIPPSHRLHNTAHLITTQYAVFGGKITHLLEGRGRIVATRELSDEN